MPEPQSVLTRRLLSTGRQDSRAADRLFPMVYDELRRIAAGVLAREQPGHTLQPTALVHEAYLRLVGSESIRVCDRAYFFATAVQAMRRILVEHARRRARPKHGGGMARISLDAVDPLASAAEMDWLAFDEVLSGLERTDPRAFQVVVLRVFADMTVVEVAEVLEISTATVKREWTYSLAWLRDRLGTDTAASGPHGE